uniref:Uncharacterized protein n=1 Tax=Populus trichocarpa TaxID=3694 RepID=A0A2K1R4B2_POPTR
MKRRNKTELQGYIVCKKFHYLIKGEISLSQHRRGLGTHHLPFNVGEAGKTNALPSSFKQRNLGCQMGRWYQNLHYRLRYQNPRLVNWLPKLGLILSPW